MKYRIFAQPLKQLLKIITVESFLHLFKMYHLLRSRNWGNEEEFLLLRAHVLIKTDRA